jgi:hypothetical protein
MKNTNKMITMKSIYILTAFLGLQFNTIFAAGYYSDLPATTSNTASSAAAITLAPSTPAEATFEEFSELTLITLAPVTPREAIFEDETGTGNRNPQIELAPATPAVADFEEHV